MIKKLSWLAFISFLVYLTAVYGKLSAGWIFLFAYFLLINKGTYLFLTRLFAFSANLYTKFLGVFLAFFIWSFALGAVLFFNVFNGISLALTLFLNGVFWLILEKYLNSAPLPVLTQKYAFLPKINLPFQKILSAIFLILAISGFYFLAISQNNSAILTPWQTIHWAFIYVFFGAVFVLGLLIFTKLAPKTILLFLIVLSFLMHFYLPLTHEFFYGADGWRHIASMEQILSPTSSPQNIDSSAIVSPYNFDIGRLSYGNFWGIELALNLLIKSDFVNITKWFLPILFSLFFPLLLFELARAFSFGKRESLFIVWLGLLPFALQAIGAMSLPVSYGFLIFIFGLILLAKHWQNPKTYQIWFLLAFNLFLIFGYALYFILFVLFFTVGEICLFKIKKDARVNHGKKYRIFLYIFIVSSAFLTGLILPTLEIVAHYSSFKTLDLLSSLKQFIGNYSAFYMIGGSRLHDISTGNILFNQVPLYAYTQNLFNHYLWFGFIFAVWFFALLILGAIKIFNRGVLGLKITVWFTLAITFSYFVSRYCLLGEMVLTRRLDMVLALFYLLLFVYGLFAFLKIISHFKYLSVKAVLIILIFILAFEISFSYSLGPDTQVISKNEWRAVNFIYQKEKNNSVHCILADTYPLLALEAMSFKKIVGGGWPINEYFAQPLKEDLRREVLFGTSTTRTLAKIEVNCLAKSFWVLSDLNFEGAKFGQEKIKSKIQFDGLNVWEYNLREEK